MAFSFDLAVIVIRRSMVRRRRRKDMYKSHKPMPEIPFDVVTEILSRLPAKSLMRFKSVSKLWLSSICSKYFGNSRLKLSSSPRLFMYLSLSDNGHLKDVLLSSSPSPYSEEVTTMSSFVVDQDLTVPSMKGYYISHVFRGLMCFVNEPSAQIYNITTRQLVILPDIEESNIIAEDHEVKKKKITYHIVHDPIYDQYKVVCIVARPSDEVEFTFLSEHWILLLGGEGSSRWKKISCGSPPHLPLTQGLTINGRMHYLAWVRAGTNCVLMILDINSEEISMLQVPKDIFWCNAGLIEYGGKIALLHYTHLKIEGVMELWVVEDAEKNIWRNKILVVDPSQMHMISSIGLRVQGTTRKGEVILALGETNLFNIFLYDLQKNHIRKVEIKGGPNRHITKIFELVALDDVENLMQI